MLSRVKRHFFVGIFTLAPFALTLYLLLIFGRWFDALFQPAIQVIHRPFFDGPIPGLGIIVGLVIIILVGMMAPSFLGKQVMRISEVIVVKIPLAKAVYSATKQIFDAFSQPSGERFSRVVIVPFLREGSYAVGFVTKEVSQGWVPGKPETKLSVFVPTAPNPTSGFLIFINPKETYPLDLTIEDGLKLVLSAGLAKPAGTSLEDIKAALPKSNKE